MASDEYEFQRDVSAELNRQAFAPDYVCGMCDCPLTGKNVVTTKHGHFCSAVCAKWAAKDAAEVPDGK